MTASLARAVVVVAAERERENCLLAALMGRKRRAACMGVKEECKVCELKKRDATEQQPFRAKNRFRPLAHRLIFSRPVSLELGSNVTSDNSL